MWAWEDTKPQDHHGLRICSVVSVVRWSATGLAFDAATAASQCAYAREIVSILSEIPNSLNAESKTCVANFRLLEASIGCFALRAWMPSCVNA